MTAAAPAAPAAIPYVVTSSAAVPMPGAEPFVENVGSGTAYARLDAPWVVPADANGTGGRVSLTYEVVPEGSGPGPHKRLSQ